MGITKCRTEVGEVFVVIIEVDKSRIKTVAKNIVDMPAPIQAPCVFCLAVIKGGPLEISAPIVGWVLVFVPLHSPSQIQYKFRCVFGCYPVPAEPDVKSIAGIQQRRHPLVTATDMFYPAVYPEVIAGLGRS